MTASPSGPVERLTDATAGPGTAVAFGALSALRRRRIFHPTGAAFSATVDIDPGDPVGAPLFDERARRRAIIRLSRGAGTPEPLPDIFGLAVRVLDAHGPDQHQDLLMVSSGTAPGLRHALLPAAGHGAGFYSSILPLRVGGRNLLIGAQSIRDEDTPPLPRLSEVEGALVEGRLRFELVFAEFSARGCRSVASRSAPVFRRPSPSRSSSTRSSPAAGSSRPGS